MWASYHEWRAVQEAEAERTKQVTAVVWTPRERATWLALQTWYAATCDLLTHREVRRLLFVRFLVQSGRMGH